MTRGIMRSIIMSIIADMDEIGGIETQAPGANRQPSASSVEVFSV